MSFAIKRFFLPILAISIIFSLVAGLGPKESPGETMARMKILGELLATTNENHAFLRRFTGDWMTETSIMGMEPSKGTSSNKMIFGDRFLEGVYAGDYMGVTFEGRMTMGYDNYKKKFIVSYIDSLGTSMRTAEGMLDQTGNVLSLWGFMDEWMTGEHDKPVMYRYIWNNKDHFTTEVHDLGIVPGNSKVIQVEYYRVTP